MKRWMTLCAIAALSVCCILGACGENKIADNTEHFDDITKSLKLTKSYEGKKLMSDDGIGEATLVGDTTDGDTTYFYLKEGGNVNVRYQGVDTPESTFEIEKWGKAASKFTNERLHAATTIVLESASGGYPETDSVGTRSLCYVWYKTETDDFKLLNLELVENGYSLNKENADNDYYSYFQKAEQFAKGIQLRMHSKLDDPLFTTDAVDITLKEFSEHSSEFKEGTRIRLDAYIREKTVSGGVTYIIGQYDEATHTEYTLQFYAGYTNSLANLEIGELYHIVGTLQKHSDRWQITGVTLNNKAKGDENETWFKQLDYYLIFDATHAQSGKLYNCFGDVTVTSVSLEGATLTFRGTAPNEEVEKVSGNTSFTFTVTVPSGATVGIREGTVLSVSGCYQTESGSGKLTVANYSDITIKNE